MQITFPTAAQYIFELIISFLGRLATCACSLLYPFHFRHIHEQFHIHCPQKISSYTCIWTHASFESLDGHARCISSADFIFCWMQMTASFDTMTLLLVEPKHFFTNHNSISLSSRLRRFASIAANQIQTRKHNSGFEFVTQTHINSN